MLLMFDEKKRNILSKYLKAKLSEILSLQTVLDFILISTAALRAHQQNCLQPQLSTNSLHHSILQPHHHLSTILFSCHSIPSRRKMSPFHASRKMIEAPKSTGVHFRSSSPSRAKTWPPWWSVNTENDPKPLSTHPPRGNQGFFLVQLDWIRHSGWRD